MTLSETRILKKIVRRSYATMELLRKLSEYHPPNSDMIHVYIPFVRSLLEQSSNVWHSSLSQENKIDLERVQTRQGRPR